MKLSLILTAALASVTTADTSRTKTNLRRGLQTPFSGSSDDEGVSCSDFEGRWEAIDGDDYSNLLISIVCDGDTANIRYSDDKWAAGEDGEPGTCGEFGGPGGFEAEYTLNTDDSSIDGDGVLEVKCQDGTEETKDFGLDPGNKFVLQDNGGLQWFEFYNFWPTSTN